MNDFRSAMTEKPGVDSFIFLKTCKMFRFPPVFIVLVTLGCVTMETSCQDILGCGGFVKSEVEINFSLVEVKLFTKQGSLKYRTDCAPNNGYYMVPVYDKGDYILQVHPPPGWTFEPESVELHIDGATDVCSKGVDVNFQFTGFGIVGKVVSEGEQEGPGGVSLVLTRAGSTQVVKQTQSVEGGEYTFDKILPGEYDVTATHPKWTFEKASTAVTVGRETGNAGSSITIRGYDVTGRVLSDGEAIRGVHFVVYSTNDVKHDVTDCNHGDVPGMPSKDAAGTLCYVTSDKDGVFTFPSLTPADYRIVPFYKGDHITFDVVPSEVLVSVRHDSVVLEESFQVAGFSVQGKVRNVDQGVGVPGAVIYLDGREQAVSKEDGTYHLDSMRIGRYTLLVKHEYLFFDPVTVKVTPNTPHLPDILPARYSLCGRVIIDKLPASLSDTRSTRDVTLTSTTSGSPASTLTTDAAGQFCTDVPPGDYQLKVVVSESEKRAGLKLAPAVVKVTIKDSPSLSTVFSQFRASISGDVTCLEKCVTQQISLVTSGRSEDNKITQVVGDGKVVRFVFTDVMPGSYKVSLVNEAWCWKEKMFDVKLVDGDVTDLHFVQSGYILSSSLSHDITLNFAQEKKPGNVGSFDLSKGVNKFCLSEPGVYTLQPSSCHMFQHEVYTYDTSSPSILTLNAIKHQIEGVVVTDKKHKDLTVKIRSSSEGAAVILGPLVHEKEDKDKKTSGPFTYKFHHWAGAGERLDIEIQSPVLLFDPPSAEINMRGDMKCPGEVVKFVGREGMFISGLIAPPIEGVLINIRDVNNDVTNIALETGKDGKFSVGPLDGNHGYSVSAEKEGFIFTEVEGKLGHFNAFKLGEINVKVVDTSGSPLQAVLLSLSGSNQYRSNKLTQTDGDMAFLGLSPGQYFLRPMMKEYSFSPASRMITVDEGGTIHFTINATRIAFSSYGTVRSLNGEPEADIVVEAVGLASCSDLQEESKTEQDGTYRIRGLQPACEYEIRLKTGDVNQHIERSYTRRPSLKVDQDDVVDVNVIAFRRINELDLSGNVVTHPDHLSTLKIHLYKESNPDNPLHTISLHNSCFFYLPSLTIDNQNYVIRMDSSLSRTSYDYTVTEVTFVANTSHQHFTFSFQPKPRMLEQELSHSSFLVLPFTLLLILLAYHHQKVLPVLAQAVAYIQSLLSASSTSSSASPPPSTAPATYHINPELFPDTSTSTKKKQKARKA